MPLPKTAVSLPEVSETAYFRIDLDALEQIQETVLTKKEFDSPEARGMGVYFELLDRLDFIRIKKIVDLTLVDATPEQVFVKYKINDIAEKLADAMSKTLYGRTVAEQVEHREREYVAHLQKLAEKKKASDNVE